MKKLILTFITLLFVVPTTHAGVGINAGVGFPFVSQLGVNVTMGNSWTLNASQNTLDLSSGEASVKLSMPELSLSWHPFAGAFFVGLGVGQETLEVSATDQVSGLTASAEVKATTTLAKLGWMWGRGDGGLWFGMDLTFVSPSGGEVDIEAPGLTSADQEYKDVEEAGKQFGETAYTNITFARLGYIF